MASKSTADDSSPASGIDGPIDTSATQAAPIRRVDDGILGQKCPGTSSCIDVGEEPVKKGFVCGNHGPFSIENVDGLEC